MIVLILGQAVVGGLFLAKDSIVSEEHVLKNERKRIEKYSLVSG